MRSLGHDAAFAWHLFGNWSLEGRNAERDAEGLRSCAPPIHQR